MRWRTIRRELDGRVPLIGFSGSPWTLATYMVEGGGTKNFAQVKGMMFDRPELMHQLLSRVADSGHRLPECADCRRCTGR